MPPLPKQTIDLTGRTFGRLLVLAYAGVRNKRTYWTCKCLSCGSIADYQAANLRSGRSTHCRDCSYKHRKRRKRRFHRPGYYSWRRITTAGEACEAWMSFEQFLADMGEPPKGKRNVVRIDPAKPYQPGNCIWTTTTPQRLLTYDGRTMPLVEWARELGLSRQGLYLRLKAMPLGEALTRPVQKRSG